MRGSCGNLCLLLSISVDRTASECVGDFRLTSKVVGEGCDCGLILKLFKT